LIIYKIFYSAPKSGLQNVYKLLCFLCIMLKLILLCYYNDRLLAEVLGNWRTLSWEYLLTFTTLLGVFYVVAGVHTYYTFM
jgi:hypothetical protein